jgi:dTDP-4-dehydrorhamnose reductase
MKKILILGSTGNLGGQLVKEFSNLSDYQVLAYNYKEVNLLEPNLIVSKIKKIKPDIIINAIGYNAVDKCEEIEEEFEVAYKINVRAVKYLAQVALVTNSILVQMSSDYVFGGNICQENNDSREEFLKIKEVGGFTENAKRCPINKYGQTKMLGEDEVLKLSDKKLKYYIIRTSKPFGPQGTSPSAKESFFDQILKMVPGKKEISVVNEELSCFTYTPDLARQIREILEDSREFGIYHIRNSEPAIWCEAASELFKLKKISIKIKPVLSESFPRPAKRPKYSVLANTKLPPLRSWKEALKEYIINYKQ